ncbi:hypothetical protein GCU60_08760 [Blastococcus saxobsidens]|uniref:Uncharacterized protein n=1 Tax=Blastococcus saxobsidens TaxID=138336 RepID=A0A6L9W2Y9_9ACTN|nr:hypothetical protein [Blastococcus saxobsidens]NEK85851.1 hypothetical protein [Blastococcus saxobsidens]
MTEPSAQRPVPGPPRPGPVPSAAPASATAEPSEERAAAVAHGPGERLAGLDSRPVAEHVAVFEAEHERLQRELGTIDPL